MATGNALAAATGGLVAASAATSGDYSNSGLSPSLSNGSSTLAVAHQGNQGYHQLSVTSKLL